jgi:hypothetical protein
MRGCCKCGGGGEQGGARGERDGGRYELGEQGARGARREFGTAGRGAVVARQVMHNAAVSEAADNVVHPVVRRRAGH